ncbi:DNA-binding XRE family transcriptional regulator [Bradyrhizobium sp. GM0.4]
MRRCDIVPGMVTKRNQSPIRPARRQFYLKAWRKFMGTRAVELAETLDIERESYYRLEKNWWTINAGEMDLIAKTIGIKPSQLWFPPPAPGREVVSLDDLIEEMDDPIKQQAAIMAVRGIAGR